MAPDADRCREMTPGESSVKIGVRGGMRPRSLGRIKRHGLANPRGSGPGYAPSFRSRATREDRGWHGVSRRDPASPPFPSARVVLARNGARAARVGAGRVAAPGSCRALDHGHLEVEGEAFLQIVHEGPPAGMKTLRPVSVEAGVRWVPTPTARPELPPRPPCVKQNPRARRRDGASSVPPTRRAPPARRPR